MKRESAIRPVAQVMTPELLKCNFNARKLARLYNESSPRAAKARRRILERLLGAVGEETCVDVPFRCDYGKNVFIGKRVLIGMNCTFVDNARIEIGDEAMIAGDVQICTATHSTDPAERLHPCGGSWYTTLVAPVKVGARAWIGAKAVICPGVTIGENAVVGAGAVVVRDVPPNAVAAGVPARVIRRLPHR